MTGRTLTIIAAGLCVGFASVAYAQRPGPGAGPVAAACQQDIEKLCSGKEHGAGAVRDCLESSKAKVSAACAAALNSTGVGRRQ